MFVGEGRGILATSKLLKVDRQLMILDMLTKKGGSLRISEISKGLEASVVTVRRDVTDLARQGLVATTHGGVRLLREGTMYEIQYENKLREETEYKENIGRRATEMIPDGATVFLDGGTTVGALAHHLFHREVTLITNALNVANVVAGSKSVRLIMIGGTFRQTSHTFLGPKAIRALQELRFDIAFMGTEGFDPQRGVEVPDESDAEFKNAAVQLATEVVLLATASKCNKRRLYRFAEWSDIKTFILDGEIDVTVVDEISSQGVSVVWAGRPVLSST